VTVSKGSLSLPVLTNERNTFITGVKKTAAMGAIVPITIPPATITANTVNAPDLG
jgi:hypothetical protein